MKNTPIQGQAGFQPNIPPKTSRDSICKRKFLLWSIFLFLVFSILPLLFDDLLLQIDKSTKSSESATLLPLKYYALDLPSEITRELPHSTKFFSEYELKSLLRRNNNSSLEIYEVIPVRSFHKLPLVKESKMKLHSLRLWFSDCFDIASILTFNIAQFSSEKYQLYGPSVVEFCTQAYHSQFVKQAFYYSSRLLHYMKKGGIAIWKRLSKPTKPVPTPKQESPKFCTNPIIQEQRLQERGWSTELHSQKQCTWKDKETVELVSLLGNKLVSKAMAQMSNEYQQLNQSISQQQVLIQELQEQLLQYTTLLQQEERGTTKNTTRKKIIKLQQQQQLLKPIELDSLKEQVKWIASQVSLLVNNTATHKNAVEQKVMNSPTTAATATTTTTNTNVIPNDLTQESLRWSYYLGWFTVVVCIVGVFNYEKQSRGYSTTFFYIPGAIEAVNNLLLIVQGIILGSIIAIAFYYVLIPIISVLTSGFAMLMFLEQLQSKFKKPKSTMTEKQLNEISVVVFCTVLIGGFLASNTQPWWIVIPLLSLEVLLTYKLVSKTKE